MVLKSPVKKGINNAAKAPAPKKAPALDPKAVEKATKKAEAEQQKLAEKGKKDNRFRDHGRIQTGFSKIDYQGVSVPDHMKAESAMWACILGARGLPRGKIMEIFADNGVGKSSLAMRFAAMVQQADKVTVGITDVERAFNEAQAKRLGLRESVVGKDGVEHPFLLANGSSSGEEAIQDTIQMMNVRGAQIVIHDSVAATTPGERAREGKDRIGDMANLWSRRMPDILNAVSQNDATLILINQVRTNIGVMFGDNTTTTGGKSIAFYARVRWQLWKKKVEVDKDTKQEISYEVAVKTIKNSLTGPKPTFDVKMRRGHIVDLAGTAVQWAKKWGLVNKNEKTIAGLPVQGNVAHESSLEESVKGKEEVVFNAIFDKLQDLQRRFEAGEDVGFEVQKSDSDELQDGEAQVVEVEADEG